MKIIKKILFLLSPKERLQGGFLLVMALVMAFIDMIGVASILPFVAVLTNPSLIETNVILNTMSVLGGLLPVTFKAYNLFTANLLKYARIYYRKRLLEKYVYQPYSWILNKNSADFSEVNLVVQNSLNPLLQAITQTFVVLAIVSF